MNRKITFLLIVVLSMLVLCTPAMADTQADTQYATISRNYKEIYYQGETYSIINTDSGIIVHPSERQDISIQLSEIQQQEIYHIEASGNENIVELQIMFKGGSYVYASYLNTKHTERVNGIDSGWAEYYVIYAEEDYLKENPIVVTSEVLIDNSLFVRGYSLAKYDMQPVYGYCLEGEISCLTGYLIYFDDNSVYYLSRQFFQGIYEREPNLILYDTVSVYAIKDAELLEQLHATNESTDVDSGELDAGAIVIVAILSVIFIVGPVVMAIVCMVLAHKAKQPYKKYFKVISGLLWGTAIVPAVVLIIAIIAGLITG